MTKLIRGIELIEKSFVYLSTILMAILPIFVFYEVIARYIFNSPTIWANELSNYILQFIVFFSMGYLLIRDEHIKVTFLIDSLNGIARRVMKLITNLLVIPYSIILVIYGFEYTSNSFKLGAVSPTLLEFPLWIPYSFIAIGGVLLLTGSVCAIAKIILMEFYLYNGEGG